jgi:dTDP-glucose 4,6-dehydratase
MHLLVTGGAGFIGSNFVRFVLREHPGVRITNLDALTYAGNPENLDSVASNPNYRFLHGDICDRKIVDQALAGGGEQRVDAIVHFAAESHVDRSILGSADFVRTNVTGTHTLLEAARTMKTARVFIVSTDEVYGSLGAEGAFFEETPLCPSSPYSATKAAADLLSLAYFRTHGLPVIVTRASNNYGPYQFPEKLIPLLISNGLDGKPLPIYGDGLNVRDWLHVEDHCEGLWVVLNRGREGEVYNIGGASERRNIDVARAIQRHLGLPDDRIQYITDRPGHDRRYALDLTKIQRELGWRPRRVFESSLADVVEWYRVNRAWWERVRSGAYKEYYRRNYEGRELHA